MKMTLGLLLMSTSMAVMIAAANQENRQTTVTQKGDPLVWLPDPLMLADGNKLAHKNKDGAVEVFHAGRLDYDPGMKTFTIYGVLPDNERDRIIETTAPAGYREKVDALKKASEKIDGKEVKEVSVQLDKLPPDFDMKYAGLKKSVVRYDAASLTLTAFQPLADKEVKALLLAAGEPGLRDTMHELYVQSNRFCVSPWWLFWSYILATLGELCLSPVGLSMVSKLAPARFATMLMGVWMLTSAFGNFAAGALGEVWGTIPPVQFFLLSTAVVGGAAVVLFVLVRRVVALMHGVK
jgi:POT family proton-dependent oligopeptide transporter